MAGYSGTPLLKKLGIKPGLRVLLISPPSDYFELLDTDISNQLVSKEQAPDFIHLFAKDNYFFEESMKPVLKFCKKNPAVIIWVSWYKKSSGMATDLTEDVIRQFALKNTLVDIKVCAVSNEWSGLKLVVPVSKRG